MKDCSDYFLMFRLCRCKTLLTFTLHNRFVTGSVLRLKSPCIWIEVWLSKSYGTSTWRCNGVKRDHPRRMTSQGDTMDVLQYWRSHAVLQKCVLSLCLVLGALVLKVHLIYPVLLSAVINFAFRDLTLEIVFKTLPRDTRWVSSPFSSTRSVILVTLLCERYRRTVELNVCFLEPSFD